MNVEGLPWYKKGRASGGDESRNGEKFLNQTGKQSPFEGCPFLISSGRHLFGVIALFILFCIFVWFK